MSQWQFDNWIGWSSDCMLSVQNFILLACLEVAEKFVVGSGGVEWSGGGGLGQFLGSALVKLNYWQK